ncbi:MAG: hypothetical protein PX636_16660, partial [Microcystis sp. M53598_WE2]|uniref:hypothetical protein n=1 Tax=Microcystis sp. M53598_WE2 TaxID=3030677 RepID=UPI002589E146
LIIDKRLLKGVVKLKDDPNQLGTEITLIARIALHLSYSDLTTPAEDKTIIVFIQSFQSQLRLIM